jgi:hypothetical protein
MYKRLIFLLLNIFIFSLIYFSLGDTNFSGLNRVEELIKNEVIKKNVNTKIENFESDIPIRPKDMRGESPKKEIKRDLIVDNNNTSDLLEEKTKEIKVKITKKELALKSIKPSMLQIYFDKLYFSFTTGTTLGFGDIVPSSNVCKFFVVMQLIITISIIFFLK